MLSGIKTKLKQVPAKPGVYFFKSSQEEILYIGKAINLRNRVRSYFQKNKYQTPKTQSLVKRISDIEWIVVRNEVEALLTEITQIKKHRPHYNIDLKDDKTYPYIRITQEPFPRVFITRDIVRDGSKYFGPYTDVMLLRRSLKAVHKIFPVRSCDFFLDQEVIEQRKVKLCLDYHIKKCQGPCEDLVSKKNYQSMIKRVIGFLHGDTAETEQFIRNQMNRASSDLRFEDAGMYRDQLKAIRSFKERQRKVAANFEDRDVFALAKEEEIGIVVVVRIRGGRIFSREKIFLQKLEDNKSVIFESVITRFYLETDFIPKEITAPSRPANEDQIRKYLKGKKGSKVQIHIPQRGEKAKEVRLAYQNAKLLLSERLMEKKKRRELVPKMVATLQEDLKLQAPPRRIEAFDISHLGGTNTVASMVCFIDGKPKKNDYRKFKIKTVKGIDDFASMREVVFRRYKRVKKEEGRFPDLILIDGGKGQLSMAVSALRELGLDYLPAIGLAKRLEEIFIPGTASPQSIPKQSPGLILLRRIRDEAHRFAITYQKQKRKKTMENSLFSEISGMGPNRIRKLLTQYKDIQTIGSLNPDQLQRELGFPRLIAVAIIEKAKNTT